MSESTDSGTRLDEAQVAAVLRRAAELQQEGGRPSPAAKEGLAPSELVQIGSELGLDAECIRAAILEIQTGQVPAARGGLFGGPVRVEIEREFDAELTDDAWDALVAEFRRAFGKVGTTSLVGGVREWAGGEDLEVVHASLRSSGGKTRVRILSDRTNGTILAGVLSVLFSMVGSLLIAQKAPAGPAGKVLWIFAFALTILAVVRSLYVGSARRRDKALTRVMASAENLFSRPAAQALPQAQPQVETETRVRLKGK